MTRITLDMYQTMAVAVAALYLGQFIKRRAAFLEKFCIPVPVIGGTVFSVLSCILYMAGIVEIVFTDTLKDVCMVFFFTTVGFHADLRLLKTGGRVLVKMIVLVAVIAFSQNALSVGLAVLMRQSPLVGMCAGSVAILGGHGTSAAFAPLLEARGMSGAFTFCTASATFGLIAGSLIGGPIANSLIVKKDLIKTAKEKPRSRDEKKEKQGQLVSYARAAFQLAVAAGIGTALTGLLSRTGMVFPQYIGPMLVGCAIGNIGSFTGKRECFTREIEDISSIMLELFLGMALISLKIWQLFALALPLTVLLAAQTLFMVLFTRFIVFPFLGKDYDAAVMTSGVCGFGMGATPNALSNMQAVTFRRPPSYTAFLVIPIMGGMFLDIINSFTVLLFLNLI